MEVLIVFILIASCLGLAAPEAISLFSGRKFTVLPFPGSSISTPVTLVLENRINSTTLVTITGRDLVSVDVNISALSLNSLNTGVNFATDNRWPLHIVATGNISVIYKIHPQTTDVGITRLLPNRFLGTDYVAMTTCGNLYSERNCSIVVGTSSRTNVSVFITLPRANNFSKVECEVVYNGITYSNEECIYTNVSYSEYVHLESVCDLTGTVIVGSGELTVLSGSYNYVDQGISLEQLLPNSLWRSEYLVYTQYEKQSLVVVSKEENTTIKVYDHGQFATYSHPGVLYLNIYPNEIVHLISSKQVSVFLSSETSLSTVIPFSFFGTLDLKNDSLPGFDIVLVHSDASGNPFSCVGCVHPCPFQQPFGGGYFTDGEWAGTMLDAVIDDLTNEEDGMTIDSSMMPTLDTDSQNEPVASYGRFFILPIFGDKDLAIYMEQEVVLNIILKDESTTVITVKEPLMTYSVTDTCTSITVSTNETLVTINATADVLLYVKLRFMSNVYNTTDTFLLLPVASFGYEYRIVSPNWDNNQTWRHICHVIAVENSTELDIQELPKTILHEYKSFEMEPPGFEDISGLLIKASKPVGVVCRGYTNVTNVTNSMRMGLAHAQLPPVNTWGNLFRIKLPIPVSSLESVCIKVVKYELYTNLRFEEHIPNEVEKISFTLDGGTDRVIDICDRFPLHDNSSVVIQSNHPILVSLIFESKDSFETNMIILSPHSQTLNYTFRDFDSCTFETNHVGSDSFVNPFVTLGSNKVATAPSKLATTYKPFMESDQIPGDEIDNDGDGLVDEDFCQFLISDSNELLDLDFDGRINEDCAGCKVGYELNSTLSCSECKIGHYRHEVGVDVCIRCENLTTLYWGTVEEGQCVVNCLEGEEFDNQTQTCKPCSIGFYKNTSSINVTASFTERWYCRPCPPNLTTVYNGTEYIEDCIENCDAGYQLNMSVVECIPCGYNKYKAVSSANGNLTFEERWECTDCPLGKLTMSINATHCVDECQQGEQFNTTREDCVPCEKGYYKNTTGNFGPCDPCPQNATTAGTGSVYIDDCKAGCWCPCNMVSPVINYTQEELRIKLEELRKKLTLDKRKLTSFTTRKISAPDDRTLSKAVGSLGAIVIAGVVIVLLLFDIMILKEHFKMLLENLKFFHERLKGLTTRKVVNQSPS